MKSTSRFTLLFFAVLVCQGCEGCVDRRFRDIAEDNLRRSFRVPENAALLQLGSEPKWETLTLTDSSDWAWGVFEFTQKDFKAYLELIKKKEGWARIPWRHYSPTMEDEYSEASLEWRYLSELNNNCEIAKRFTRELEDKVRDVKNGKFYCWGMTSRGGGNKAVYRRAHCFENPDAKLYGMVGVIDFKTRRLYAQGHRNWGGAGPRSCT